MFCREINRKDENFQQKVDDALIEAYEEFDKNKKENYCILMYDLNSDDTSIIRILDKKELCNYLYTTLTWVYERYIFGHKNSVETDAYRNDKCENLLLADINGGKFYFGTKDYASLRVIRGILGLCANESNTKLFFTNFKNDYEVIHYYNYRYSNELNILKQKVVKEEIPREKTLSKKEKEKLKKQMAKEANKLREQEKKDKAKLAEQQAKQFEKQQKERERKRIEIERKKKLALLKK